MIQTMSEAFMLGALIVMAVSPAIFLLCVASKNAHKAIAVCLFVVSLAGFIGLKYVYDKVPQTVNNLYYEGTTE
jgi:hypothetical protein